MGEHPLPIMLGRPWYIQSRPRHHARYRRQQQLLSLDYDWCPMNDITQHRCRVTTINTKKMDTISQTMFKSAFSLMKIC